MASYRVSGQLSIGGGPVITSGTMSISPAFFAAGPKRDGGVLSTFPAATNARQFWGGGFQLGVLYELNKEWNLGFSYKSPVWQERCGFNAANPDLSLRRIRVQAQIPAIYFWGVAYKGIDRALIDVDLRYFDYANADLFGQSVRDGGLGWRGVFAVATGGQYAVTDRLTLRVGYLFNTNPIPATATLFNVQLPGITQHTLSFGSSFALTEDITMSAAWVHRFRNSIQGNLVQETGAFTKLDTQTAPSFLPVSGLNAQFELSAGADYRGGTERGAIDNFGSGMLRFADRSTLTFAPQRSPELTRSLLTQVNLDTLYLFSKEGWGPEHVVRLFVRTINGIDNASSGGGPIPPDPPEFAEFRTLSDLLASL